MVEVKDIVAIEKIREFKSRYHVLGGAIDPIGSVGPDDLRITQLMSRLGSGRPRRSSSHWTRTSKRQSHRRPISPACSDRSN